MKYPFFIFKADCSDSDNDELQRDLQPLKKKQKKEMESKQVSLGLLSCDVHSETGSSIIPPSENRYPIVVLECLREV